jgi:SNF2 family DNA or RNA helicase
MKLTSYHAKYFAHELTRQLPSNDIGKFTASLQDAQVDLNPHQVEAALFAFQSPLSNGAILADEVGLGKTIEAGIILSQKWAERRRKLIIICPSNLRKQWSQELADKFYLPSTIIETKTFNQAIKEGRANPFNLDNSVAICSYQFARNKEVYLEQTKFDLVIIDEAHRLRNVYKASNKVANSIKNALIDCKKVLLTATPLQNSVLELYGLVSIVDDYVFGDLKSFKSQFGRQLDDSDYHDLRQRLQPVCKRTLRKQVLEYINYTSRKAFVEEFYPTVEEQALYDGVSAYLQRPKLFALPSGQRQLMTLVLRKLLASSTYAICNTLSGLVHKLETILLNYAEANTDVFADEYESYEALTEDWLVGDENEEQSEERIYSKEELDEIKNELVDLQEYMVLAETITKNTKAEHLFTALDRGFTELDKLGAPKKALIFTESRRTQQFLNDILESRGYAEQIVLFNGANDDARSNKIYRDWKKEHIGTDRMTGSPTADKRAAIVDYFRNEATIMIATEAAAEGINLQFCSLLVNYDLPWNPQRIEQRIGRCHRYGQKFDVVVINFLNRANAADLRVYQLLEEKFRLFDGVFGASDEVLGSIGNGVDFEKSIAQIYQNCRTTEEIEGAFNDLQESLRPDIDQKVKSVRSTLLENFDEEVREKLRTNYAKTKENLNAFELKLWNTTKFYLQQNALFNDASFSFKLNTNPFPNENIHRGPYMILKPGDGQRKSDVFIPDDTNIYRVGHRLAQRILDECKGLKTIVKEIVFDYTNTPTKITVLENHIGQSGWFQLHQLSINSFEQEDHLLIACITDDGEVVEQDTASRLFSLYAEEKAPVSLMDNTKEALVTLASIKRQGIIADNANRNQDFFDLEMDKLDQWADDMKISLEKEIKDLDAEIKLKKGEAKKNNNLEEKIKLQREIKELEKHRGEKRRTLFVAQDQIDERKEHLLNSIEERIHQNVKQIELFTFRWTLI